MNFLKNVFSVLVALGFVGVMGSVGTIERGGDLPVALLLAAVSLLAIGIGGFVLKELEEM